MELQSCTADHLYKSSNMSVRGRRVWKKGLHCPRQLEHRKGRRKIPSVSMYIVGKTRRMLDVE